MRLCRLNDDDDIYFAFSNMAIRTQRRCRCGTMCAPMYDVRINHSLVCACVHISSTNHFRVNALVASPTAYTEHYASVTFSGWHLEHCNKCTFIVLSRSHSFVIGSLLFIGRVLCVCVLSCVSGESLLLLLLPPLPLLLLRSIVVVVCHSVIVFNRNSIDYTQRNAKTRNRQNTKIQN